MKVKWVTLENESGTATLSQHAFIPEERHRRYTGELYIGNRSICGRIVAGNENEEVDEFENLEDEPISVRVCGQCKGIVSSLTTSPTTNETVR